MIQKKCRLFHVHQIQDASSEWNYEPSAVAASIIDFFQQLLASGASQFHQSGFDFIMSLVIAKDHVDLYKEPDMDD